MMRTNTKQAEDVKRVIIVEDEETLANNLSDKMQGEGFSVKTVNNGEQGLELIRAEKPDLVVLDIMLPGLDGLSICRMVRNDPATAEVPIIMLTARGTEVDKIVGLESGADDYIVKPFGLGEFLARVRAVLRRSRARHTAIQHDELMSEDLTMDLTGRRV
ncbi:MAG: response regulator, partial [Chloroflexota bacterium]